MKRILFLVSLFASAAPAFAQGVIGFHNPVPPRSMYREGKVIFKAAPPTRSSRSASSPSSGMAAAVAATGAAASMLRMLEELSKPQAVPAVVTPPSSDCNVVLSPELKRSGAPPVFVVPADTGVTSVHVVPMEPVVRHPVPITVVPMDIVSVP